MKLDQKGKDHLIELEGIRLNAYLDTKGIPTIGVGMTFYPKTGKKVKLGDKITKTEVYEMLDHMLIQFEDNINKVVKVPLTQNQYNSVVGFSYNVGITAFNSSTLLKKLNAGDFKGASEEFIKWTKQKELTGRRRKEKELFLK